MINPSDKRGSVGVIGSVGDDCYGQTYHDLLSQENIYPIFEKFQDKNTAICGVFCHGKDRGHVTDLGASTMVTDEFVDANWEKIKNVQLVFTELFIIKHKKETVFKLAELGSQDEKVFGFNLPSFYFIETFLEDIKLLIEFADVIFVNAEESIFFAKMNGLETNDFGMICEFIAKFPKKNVLKRRTVVITCGPNPAYCSEYDFLTKEFTFRGTYEPEYVDEENIIDTNAAGDAFAGGFLSQYMPGKNLEECMKAGHWAAALVIQRRGCQYPVECDFGKN
jgi:adenosine kinase